MAALPPKTPRNAPPKPLRTAVNGATSTLRQARLDEDAHRKAAAANLHYDPVIVTSSNGNVIGSQYTVARHVLQRTARSTRQEMTSLDDVSRRYMRHIEEERRRILQESLTLTRLQSTSSSERAPRKSASSVEPGRRSRASTTSAVSTSVAATSPPPSPPRTRPPPSTLSSEIRRAAVGRSSSKSAEGPSRSSSVRARDSSSRSTSPAVFDRLNATAQRNVPQATSSSQPKRKLNAGAAASLVERLTAPSRRRTATAGSSARVATADAPAPLGGVSSASSDVSRPRSVSPATISRFARSTAASSARERQPSPVTRSRVLEDAHRYVESRPKRSASAASRVAAAPAVTPGGRSPSSTARQGLGTRRKSVDSLPSVFDRLASGGRSRSPLGGRSATNDASAHTSPSLNRSRSAPLRTAPRTPGSGGGTACGTPSARLIASSRSRSPLGQIGTSNAGRKPTPVVVDRTTRALREQPPEGSSLRQPSSRIASPGSSARPHTARALTPSSLAARTRTPTRVLVV